MFVHTFRQAASLAALLGCVTAHPGHDVTGELLEMRNFRNNVRHTSLDHCASHLRDRGVYERSVQRRAASLELTRGYQTSRLSKRDDADDFLSESHDQSDSGYTENTDPSTLFSTNASCLLTPEVTQGPYYVGGESIRRDVSENQPGLDLVLDYQVIDVDTCDPVPNVYVEIWHCNSTGVYSGVNANGNGDDSDENNINQTFLRGIQKTDSDGVAQFKSVFPGHYTGRATHIHIMVHTNATKYDNNTLGNTVYASHVGQAFFDQSLIRNIDKIEPYSANEQELTENSDDSILIQEAATGSDPLMDYALLGDSVADGLLAWLSFGINSSYVSEVSPAAFMYKDGGVENADSGMGGSPPGNGTGAPPNQTLPFNIASSTTGTVGTVTTGVATQSASATGSSNASRYTYGAVLVSLVGLFLPLLWP